jgi:hypothetical protein
MIQPSYSFLREREGEGERRIGTENSEFDMNDSWRASSDLTPTPTLTAGLLGSTSAFLTYRTTTLSHCLVGPSLSLVPCWFYCRPETRCPPVSWIQL